MRFNKPLTLSIAILMQACGSAAPQGPGSNNLGASTPIVTGGAPAATLPSMTPTPASTTPSTSTPQTTTPTAATPTAGVAAAPAAGTTALAAAAGAAGTAPAGAPVAGSAGTTPPAPGTNECGLHTKWAGDEYCIKPPPPDKGFQIHIGPADYDNPDTKYVLQPGAETNEFFPAMSGNTTDVYYYERQYRMRPGSHHLILTAGSGGLGGRRLGGSQNLSRDNPENGVVPPEDQDVGMKLAANTPLTVNLHYINLTTDKPELKEAWVNVWYKDAATVKEPANEMYSFAPINIPAGQHVVIHGECPVSQAGRILSHYGHRHANNLRFSTWRKRAGKQELVYEDYDWEEPLTLEYSSTVKNTPPDAANKVGGGWSGELDLMPGDTMIFECDIVNMTTHTFLGQNEAENDEMCIMIGDTVGPTISTNCTYTNIKM